MNFFKTISNLFKSEPQIETGKCAECGQVRRIEGLNTKRVCTKCTTLNQILNASNRVNRCCGICGDLFISRNDEQDCFKCRKPMRTEQRPMLDRIREMEILEREMYNGQG